MPSEPDIDDSGFNGCQGDVVYTYTYTDCAGHTQTWNHIFHIALPDDIAGVPADDGTSVPCLVDALQPAAPDITDFCGNIITPSLVDSTATLNNDGTGTVVFRFLYADCAGHDSLWTYTYTLNPESFSPAQDGELDVHCLSEVVAPSLPNISNCGETVTLYPGDNYGNIANGCGDTTFVYNYTINGTEYAWNYTYHVTPEDFAISAENGSQIVSCPDLAVAPTAFIPTVHDACGNLLEPDEPTIQDYVNGCEGSVIYTYTFADCAGHSQEWTYTYTIELPELVIPQDGSDIVNCASEASEPALVTITDACGREVIAVADANNPTVNVAANGRHRHLQLHLHRLRRQRIPVVFRLCRHSRQLRAH